MNLKYVIFLLLLFIPISSAYVYTTPPNSILDSLGFRFGNTSLTSTGIYSDNIFGNPTDIVICTNQTYGGCSNIYTFGDASSLFQLCSGKNCIIRSGKYDLFTDINLLGNTTIKGQGNVTLNISKDFEFNIDPTEINFTNFNFEGINVVGDFNPRTTPVINFVTATNINNININHVSFTGINATGTIFLKLKSGTSGNMKNIKLNNLNFFDCKSGITIKHSDELAEKIFNTKIENINFNNLLNYGSTTVGFMINVIGANNLVINNIYSKKTADAPQLNIFRSVNVKITNINAYEQLDYAVSLDSVHNAVLENIQSHNAVDWGVLYIHNTNYQDGTKNIYAKNIICDNCSQSGGGNYNPIYLSINSPSVRNTTFENVEIDGFYVNGSQSYGCVGIRSVFGNMSNIRLRNGNLTNCNEAGIYIVGNNKTKDILLENIKITNYSLLSTDNDKKAGIVFYNTNTFNAILKNIEINNTNGSGKYGIRLLTDNSPVYRTEISTELYSFNGTATNVAFSVYGNNYKYINIDNLKNNVTYNNPSEQGLVLNHNFNTEFTDNSISIDNSRYANNGSKTGSAIFNNTCVLNQCGFAEFVNTTGNITIPFSSSLTFNTNDTITISAWVYSHAPQATDVIGGQSSEILLRLNDVVKPELILNSFTTNDRVASLYTIDADTWYMVTGTYDGTNLCIYVNGILSDCVVPTGTYGGDTSNFSVGFVPLQSTWNGLINDFRIYNRALNSNEIYNIYVSKKEIEHSPLGGVSSILYNSTYDVTRGYTLQVSSLTFNPLNATTYYYASAQSAPSTTSNRYRLYVPFNGTITKAYLYWVSTSVAGTNEEINQSIGINNASYTYISSVSTTNANKLFSNNTLSLDVVEGDYIDFKLLTPTWATPPTSIYLSGTVYVKQ